MLNAIVVDSDMLPDSDLQVGDVVSAPDFSRLCEGFIPGYDQIDDEEARTIARVLFLQNVANARQQGLLDIAQREGVEATDHEYEVMKNPASEAIDLDGQRWECDIPLITIADVQEQAGLGMIDGELVYTLNGRNDKTLALSLVHLGAIDLSDDGQAQEGN